MQKDYNCKEQNNQYHKDLGLKCEAFQVEFPKQHQDVQPGMEYLMNPAPVFDDCKLGSGKLLNKVAIITGGDSGLGRAIAIKYAKEGAKVVIVYYNEHQDANYTKDYIESLGGECLLIAGDLKQSYFCQHVVDKTLEAYQRIDILVNGAGVQYPKKSLLDISDEQFDYTMRSNIYSMFYLTKKVLPYMEDDGAIINISSITTFIGEPELIDYVASKGAIVGFTRALANNLARNGQKIRVNAVAPGVFWTPLQPASWPASKIPTLGSDSAMGRAGQPKEIAAIFVYLACEDSSYVTGQVFHINGGEYNG